MIFAALAAAAPAAADPTALLAPPSSGAGPLGGIGMVGLITLVTLLPAIVLSCTSFVRFVVVFGFLRTGMGTPAAPPNQVLVGLALFMTVFVSAPLAKEMYDAGGKPYLEGRATAEQAFDAAAPALKRFLVARTADRDIELFLDVSRTPRPAVVDDIPLRVAIPSFVISELRSAFQIGLTILLPFLVIDLVAATILTSLGMVMVPPQAVALPIKLLVFVLIDGWHLVVESLIRGATA